MLGDQLGRKGEVEVAEVKAGGVVIDGQDSPMARSCAARDRRRVAPDGGRDAAAGIARPTQALRQARPGARHRPGAAPAAALRGRDAHRADRDAARRRRRRRSKASSPTARIQFRPRRQLVVHDRRRQRRPGAALPSLLSVAAEGARRGTRVRVRGEVRGGFFGLEMVHPAFKVVARGDAAADGADAGLPDHARSCRRRMLRKAVAAGAGARRPRPSTCPPGVAAARACRACAKRSTFLHQPPPGVGAGRRSKTAATRPGSA